MRITRTFEFYRDLLKWGMHYPVASFGQKVRVMRDYLKLYRQRGLTKEEYFEFAFEKQTPQFRNEFLGLNEERYYLDYLNPKKYYILARNKYFTHKILNDRGIRKSELYCFYEPEGRVSGDEVACSVDGVAAILRAKGVRQCVLKAAESSHGDSVTVISSIDFQDDDAVLHLFNGEERKLSEMLGVAPMLFESLVIQSRQLSSLNASSVNTVRFMTTLYPNGEAKVIASFIKIGRNGKCVDNAGAGGNVDACVDVETGMLQYAIRYDGVRNFHDIDTHPDSGTAINGMRIERWNEIKEQVIRFQQSFPYVKAAGWDIAITEEGPLVVEINDLWDRTGQCFIRRGWRKEIRDCFFAWQKTGKKYYMGRFNNNISTKRLEKIAKNDNL